MQWAGFTVGQAPQPFNFMNSWSWNTHYWGGWPNGVRQLSYTQNFGGGFSGTISATDGKAYNSTISRALTNQTGATGTAYDETLTAPDRGAIVYVGTLNLNQAWGRAQVMGAYQKGGEIAGGTGLTIYNPQGTDYDLKGTKEAGWAIGAGLAFNLPMLAPGDSIEMTAVYNERLMGALADATLQTPSASAYGTNPLGGPAVNFSNGKGWVVGAQMMHYWTQSFRSQIYASYTDRTLFGTADGLALTSSGTSEATAGGKGNAYSIGHAFVYSPAKEFDIGLELTYLRAEWNQAAIRTVGTKAADYVTLKSNDWKGFVGNYSTDNFIGKVCVQRNF